MQACVALMCPTLRFGIRERDVKSAKIGLRGTNHPSSKAGKCEGGRLSHQIVHLMPPSLSPFLVDLIPSLQPLHISWKNSTSVHVSIPIAPRHRGG